MTELKKVADMLTADNVSILTQTPTDNGCKNHRITYVNSESGRKLLAENEPPDLVAEIMAIWGDTPTIEEVAADDIPIDTEEEKDSSNVWEDIADAIKKGVNEV